MGEVLRGVVTASKLGQSGAEINIAPWARTSYFAHDFSLTGIST